MVLVSTSFSFHFLVVLKILGIYLVGQVYLLGICMVPLIVYRAFWCGTFSFKVFCIGLMTTGFEGYPNWLFAMVLVVDFSHNHLCYLGITLQSCSYAITYRFSMGQLYLIWGSVIWLHG